MLVTRGSFSTNAEVVNAIVAIIFILKTLIHDVIKWFINKPFFLTVFL